MQLSRKTNFLRYTGKKFIEEPEEIITESSTELWLEDVMIGKFVNSPGLEEELTLGHLISSGYIDDYTDFELLSSEIGRIVISSKNKSGLIRKFLISQTEPISKVDSLDKENSIELSVEQLMKYKQVLESKQGMHSKTGGVHGALLIDLKNNEYFVVEDIGRLNAIDKVIGHAAKKDYDFTSCVLLVTGRLTSEMVLKAVKSKIPLLGSLAVGTDLGVQTAMNAGLTLIGGLKGESFWLYNKGIASLVT